MTDTMLLLSCMKCKRITLGYAAEVLGISSSTLRYKINNDRDFKVSEVDKLCHLNQSLLISTAQVFRQTS